MVTFCPSCLVLTHSLAPGRCSCKLKLLIFKLTLWIDIFSISCEIALKQQAITWTNADQVEWHHMELLVHNLTHWPLLENLRYAIFKTVNILVSWALTRCTMNYPDINTIPRDHIEDKSAAVHVLALCHHATNHHCLNQCLPRSLASYGVTRRQWIKSMDKFPKLCKYFSNYFSYLKIFNSCLITKAKSLEFEMRSQPVFRYSYSTKYSYCNQVKHWGPKLYNPILCYCTTVIFHCWWIFGCGNWSAAICVIVLKLHSCSGV